MISQGVMNQAASGILPISGGRLLSVKTESISFQGMLKKNMNNAEDSITASKASKVNEMKNDKLTSRQFQQKPDAVQQPAGELPKSKKETAAQNVNGNNSKNEPNLIYAEDNDIAEESLVGAFIDETDLNIKSSAWIGMEEELFPKVNDLLEEIASDICDILDISEEELVKKMEILGLTMVDLPNMQVIKQLVIDNAEMEDASYLLTNEDAATALAEIYQRLDELTTELGIKDEELDSILKSVDFSEFLETAGIVEAETGTIDVIPKHMQEPEDESSLLDVSEADDTAYTLKESEITFTAVKLDENGEEQQAGTSKKQNSHEDSKDAQISEGQRFINRAADYASVNNEDTAGSLEHASEIREIASQILERIKVEIRPAQTSMELSLNPEHLGKVNLSVVSKDGLLTAQFTTQNEIAREAIESNIQLLRENLENQGIKVEKIEVALSEYSLQKDNDADTGREQGRQQSGKRRVSRINAGTLLQENAAAEASEDIVLQGRGMNINYKA